MRGDVAFVEAVVSVISMVPNPGPWMSQPLFRNEVMTARQSRWLGAIVIGQPLPLWLLSLLAVACAVVVVVFLVHGDYTRRTRVTGQLVPSLGMAPVIAPGPGILADVRVAEGQRVQAGDVLAVVSTPRATLADGDTAQALLAAIARRQGSVADGAASQRRQLQSQQAGLQAQLATLRAERVQLDAELSTRRAQQRLAEQTLGRFEELRARQYVTELQLQQQRTQVLEQVGAVQALERQALALRGQLAQLAQAEAEFPSRLAALDATEQRDSASLLQEWLETASRSQAVIKAPVSGVVSALIGQAGQTVQTGQPLLSLLPAHSVLEAHLLVPSTAVGFIEPGDAVLLRYHAFPYQKFGHHRGTVLRISRSALSSSELGSLPGNSQAGEPVYRVVVRLERPSVRAFGRDEPLKPGMVLDADILGETRPLWQWAIEPLYALSGNVSAG